MTGQVGLIDYLVLDDDEAHLVAQECNRWRPVLRSPECVRRLLRDRLARVPVATECNVSYGMAVGVERLSGAGLLGGGRRPDRHRGGTNFELFARISEKNHAYSTLNPLAA